MLYQRARPQDGERFEWNSPVRHAHRVQTPTLILHGERDTCVPAAQGYEFFRALRERGVETALCIYPGEGHGMSRRPHRSDLFRRHSEWFVRHLGLTPAAQAE